jgi:hypothetical protein
LFPSKQRLESQSDQPDQCRFTDDPHVIVTALSNLNGLDRKNARVILKPVGKLEDLKEGFTVVLGLGEKHVVKKTDAKTPPKKPAG